MNKKQHLTTGIDHHNHSNNNNQQRRSRFGMTMMMTFMSPGSNTNRNQSHSSTFKSSSSLSVSNWTTIMYSLKYLSTILMIGAFVFATVIIPQQQRQLMGSVTSTATTMTTTGSSSSTAATTTTALSNNPIYATTTTTTATTVGVTADDSTENNPMLQRIELPKDNFSGIIARPFRSWPNGTLLPCYPPTDNWQHMKVQFTPSNRGFLYVKPYKTGSSTTSGVHLRIARNVAKRRTKLNITTICSSRFDHGPDYHPGHTLYRHRIRNESFLWSILRHPTNRAISQFFHFKVSRRKTEPTDANLIDYLTHSDLNMMEDYYYRALYTKDRFDRKSVNPISAANHILRSYNFIGITERLDESFVVLMMILNLKIADILYLSAKTKGGYDDAGGRDRICTYIWPSFVSPGVDEFLHGKEWRNITRYDMLLYEAVNRSLDMTIDSLGREKFHRNLQTYQHAQQVAHTKCTPTAVFPCDSGGAYHTDTDCIWNDSGCGASCLDTVATELKLW